MLQNVSRSGVRLAEHYSGLVKSILIWWLASDYIVRGKLENIQCKRILSEQSEILQETLSNILKYLKTEFEITLLFYCFYWIELPCT